LTAAADRTGCKLRPWLEFKADWELRLKRSLMSISPPATSPEPGAPRSHREAKAQAKAAAAYAKAQRPWYKKKRFILSIALVLLVVAIAAGSGGSKSGGSSSGGAGTSGVVGQSLSNAGTTYKVTRVAESATLGDPQIGGARADGTFVVVSLDLTNTKSETKTFSDGSAKIVTAGGKEYSTSSDATLAIGDQSLLLKDIQPDLTTHGKLVFDVPPSKLSGSTLVIQDLFGNGEIKVNLGL
jgi:hypothetical protein